MAVCPLNFEQVDDTQSRIAALLVASIVGIYLYTSSVYLLFFLLLDFIMKLFIFRGVSIINYIALIVKKTFGLAPVLVDGGAKRLAGLFGLLFVALLIAAFYLDLWWLSVGVAGIFLLCSLLDVFFGFCVACHIYFYIKKIYPNFNLLI